MARSWMQRPVQHWPPQKPVLPMGPARECEHKRHTHSRRTRSLLKHRQAATAGDRLTKAKRHSGISIECQLCWTHAT